MVSACLYTATFSMRLSFAVAGISPEGITIRGDNSPGRDWVPAMGLEDMESIMINVRISRREAKRVHVHGQLGYVTEGLPCTRCLVPVIDKAEWTVDWHFKQDIDSGDPFFVGQNLELGEIVRQEIIANRPIRILCSSSCRGLCPGCGADLNNEPCRCADRQPAGINSKEM